MEDTNLTEEKVEAEGVAEENAEENVKENVEEKPMTESEYLEAQKEGLKKSIRTWTWILIFLAVVGLPLCLIIYGIAMEVMFVINLLAVLKTKKLLERLENGEASVKEVYEYYLVMQRRCTKLFALNVFLGLGFPIVGTIVDGKVSKKGMDEGIQILGDSYLDERIAKDPNAQWKYCHFCKKNKTEVINMWKMTDGVICGKCVSTYAAMLPKRVEDPLTPVLNPAHCTSKYDLIEKLSTKDLEERFEYRKKNQEEYSNFTPTRVLCDGCLEVDETNSLFRIVPGNYFNWDRAGVGSGLVHPYSAIKGIAYERIYTYIQAEDSKRGSFVYTNYNSIVFAVDDNPYMKEDTFTLKQIKTKAFGDSQTPQIEYAEQTIKELQKIFDKPIMEVRDLHL